MAYKVHQTKTETLYYTGYNVNLPYERVHAVQTRAQGRCVEPKYNIGRGKVQLDMLSMSSEQFARMQRGDQKLKKLFDRAGAVQNKFPKFEVCNGILVRVANSGRNMKDMLTQVVLPSQLRKKVLSLSYDTVCHSLSLSFNWENI